MGRRQRQTGSQTKYQSEKSDEEKRFPELRIRLSSKSTDRPVPTVKLQTQDFGTGPGPLNSH